VAIAAIVLAAAIALAVILGLYVFRSTHPNRQTIEAQGLVNFLMTHGSKPSESIAAI
jgi:uncharacterized protein YneF (UPF0154 family)